MAVAVVDISGDLVFFEKMDGTQAASVNIARRQGAFGRAVQAADQGPAGRAGGRRRRAAAAGARGRRAGRGRPAAHRGRQDRRRDWRLRRHQRAGRPVRQGGRRLRQVGRRVRFLRTPATCLSHSIGRGASRGMETASDSAETGSRWGGFSAEFSIPARTSRPAGSCAATRSRSAGSGRPPCSCRRSSASWRSSCRRQSWRGCQWLFWATIAVGLAMSAIGLTGWAADELMSRRNTWLAWPAIFALFGAIAPLFALLAQPHRGAREPLAATTAVDLAGLTVVTGFLYSFFVTAPDAGAGGGGRRFRCSSCPNCSRRLSWPACSGPIVGRAGHALERDVPPAGVRRDGRLRHADAQQLRNRPRAVPQRLRLRLRLDSAVCVLPLGGDGGAGVGAGRFAGGRSRRARTAASLGDLRGRRDDSHSSTSACGGSCRTTRCRASAICRRP